MTLIIPPENERIPKVSTPQVQKTDLFTILVSDLREVEEPFQPEDSRSESSRLTRRLPRFQPMILLLGLLAFASPAWAADPPLPETIDFNLHIRPILSNNCLFCHGPDAQERKGGTDGLRLDTEEGALADLGGHAAVVRGKPDQSELLRRVVTADEGELMPPVETGKRLTPREIQLLTRWISQGAPFAQHWSYVKPVRPALPTVKQAAWPRNAVDHFILSRLEKLGLRPSPEADRPALIRRLSLDLTGLPPSLEEVEQFVQDRSPDAYEKLVDRLLAKEAYGEHWARLWLDLARYADSAGYADDPPRTIWAYRDYVIRSFNANKPFDQFTVEQLAGDLLPQPSEEQLIATAFHRNTLTNSEGGTNDEEFRNVAIVDRVNTTFTVWMGTSMACAQCHTHKYDPLSQEEFFRFFALLNNTEDADRRDESPLLELYSPEQKEQKSRWQSEIVELEKKLSTSTPELLASQTRWQQQFPRDLPWKKLKPSSLVSREGASLTLREDDSILVPRKGKTDIYTLELPVTGRITALRLEALTEDSLPGKGPGNSGGNFVLTGVQAVLSPPSSKPLTGRYVRIELPGKDKLLSLAEVQVFRGTENLALVGEATQSSTAFEGPARLAIDGNTDGDYMRARSTTHTAVSADPWWELDLKQPQAIQRLMIWNRTDNNLHTRLRGSRVQVLDEQRKPVWEQSVSEAPHPSLRLELSGEKPVTFTAAFADHAQAGFEAASVLEKQDGKTPPKKGWAIGSAVGQSHALTLIASAPVEAEEGSRLTVTLEQLSPHEHHTLGCFRLSVTDDARVAEFARTPPQILALLKKKPEEHSEAERQQLATYYLTIAPELKTDRERLASVKKQLAEIKPLTTVPIQRELTEDKRRKTRIHLRGNYLELGDEVSEGTPAVFPPLPENAPRNRLTLARWLVDEANPLTARVLANRYWDQIFGLGIVPTVEEFGSQGELPTHPELLDWLATELHQKQWDLKQFLRLLVTSATYRQSSQVTPELLERDPDNRYLSRGPRFRLSAEMVRDQAMFVSGMLSPKMYGPSVRPLRPNLGLNAAFGGSTDWKASSGEDRYRRALYTEWRRSNPYPSMLTFDAPSREVCTIRRTRTNTPLQALVTMNDPVYVEASQALGRRMALHAKTPEDRVRHGFQLRLSRPPYAQELSRLVQLYEEARTEFSQHPEQAKQMALEPIGPLPPGLEVTEQAAWTVVANVLLNLDEMFMKR